jgi:hypothetical protein
MSRDAGQRIRGLKIISNVATLGKSPVVGITVSPDAAWRLYGTEQQSSSE